MPVTACYAALLAPLYLILSVRVIRVRRGVAAFGDGGDAELLRRIRVHANFAEYVPFALVLLGAAESLHVPRALLIAIGGLLTIGRLLHAYGVSQAEERFAFRIGGMASTFGAIGLAAAACLVGLVA